MDPEESTSILRLGVLKWEEGWGSPLAQGGSVKKTVSFVNALCPCGLLWRGHRSAFSLWGVFYHLKVQAALHWSELSHRGCERHLIAEFSQPVPADRQTSY